MYSTCTRISSIYQTWPLTNTAHHISKIRGIQPTNGYTIKNIFHHICCVHVSQMPKLHVHVIFNGFLEGFEAIKKSINMVCLNMLRHSISNTDYRTGEGTCKGRTHLN